MFDFDVDKNVQYVGDKVKNKFDELMGFVQQQFGEFVDFFKYQVKGVV